MNRDHLEGGLRHLGGRAKTAAGAVSGNPGRQFEGAYDQAAGAAQYAYGEARNAVRDLRDGGEHLVEEGRTRFRDVSARGRDLADEAFERGQHYRDRAVHHSRSIAARADENRGTTLALVAAVAFAVGWLARPTR
ncbi:CsbD family protein [Methylobacterium sp. J-088]|uniref:CsbD family protein n=1 Tax=unclassified Methylobacterium TaxID=2615210 RepID=UPI001FBA3CEC|nr:MULTISPECIES: CsbD family protein [unclassified Methylobacterium]MCJ2063038.1 CsbD family protein [Methylobacterium sp. J-088]